MNILHLSDIHFGRNDPEYHIADAFDNHDRILNELIEKLSELSPELRPKHIVFTGDIAWHGKKKEYEEALIWFRKLLSALGLCGKDISFCVGNHDVDRLYKCIGDDIHYDMGDEIDTLYRYDEIYKMEPAVRLYNEFCAELGVEPYAFPLHGKRQYSYSVGYKDVGFENGKQVRILSFNTSMMATQPGFPDDKMRLGKAQLNSLLAYGILPSGRDVWYTVALYHHSDRFLHPNETNTYEQRNAPLPELMEYVDLLLCGHTESCGKPRLTKQRGGGQMLLGGATYYSDRHINSFSMLYISENRRTLGFIPYVYEGAWQDYDYMANGKRTQKSATLPELGQFYENVRVELSDGEGTETLPFRHIEIKDGVFNTRKDPLSVFDVRGETGKLQLSLRTILQDNVDSLVEYRKLYDRLQGRKLRFAIFDGDRKIAGGDRVTVLPVHRLPEGMAEPLLTLEKMYDVRFDLPKEVTDSDRRMMSFLLQMGEGYAEIPDCPQTVAVGADRDYLSALCKSDTDHLYITAGEKYRPRLFNVFVPLGKLRLVAGPYHAAADDVRQKLETFCDGDRRQVEFVADQNTKCYIVRDEQSFRQQLGLQEDTFFAVELPDQQL